MKRNRFTKTGPGAFSIESADRGLIPGTQLKFMGQEVYSVACHETMGMWFDRLGHPGLPLTPAEISARFNEGVRTIDDDVIETVKPLLPQGNYLVGLFYVEPRMFCEDPRSPYAEAAAKAAVSSPVWVTRFSSFNAMRGGCRPVEEIPEAERGEESDILPGYVEASDFCTGYEFVRPLVSREFLNEDHLPHFRGSSFAKGTALALSAFCGYRPGGDRPEETLTHFLLDGHHKMTCACRVHKPLAVLSFLKEDWFGTPMHLSEDTIRKESEYRTSLLP